MCAGKRVANRDVFPHALLIEHLGMIAHCYERHACIPERLNYPLERFLTIRELAMDVKYTAHGAGYLAILNISLTSTGTSLYRVCCLLTIVFKPTYAKYRISTDASADVNITHVIPIASYMLISPP